MFTFIEKEGYTEEPRENKETKTKTKKTRSGTTQSGPAYKEKHKKDTPRKITLPMTFEVTYHFSMKEGYFQVSKNKEKEK